MLVSRVHLALAIAQVEGWFADHKTRLGDEKSCNRPQRNLNPGNLRWAPDRFPQTGMDVHHNAPGVDPGYVMFKDHLAGWAALENDIYAKLLRKESLFPNGWTLYKLISVYCPVGDGVNDPDHYVHMVNQILPKVDVNIPLKPIVIEEGRIVGPWKKGPTFGVANTPNWDNLDLWCKVKVER